MLVLTLALWRRLASWHLRPRRPEPAADPVWLTADAPDGAPFPAQLADVSRTGLRLLVDRPLAPGSALRLDPETAGRLGLAERTVRVLESAEDGPGHWGLRCTFVRELADAELEALGARRASPIGPDYRAYVRFPCDVRTSCRRISNSLPGGRWVKVQNVSPTGIGLLVQRALEPGEVLSVQLPGTPPRTVLACVVHCTGQREDAWLLGCTFSTELSDEELQVFGARRQEGTVEDGRAFVRFPCDLDLTCHAAEEPDPEPLPVQVINLSAGGAGLLVDRPAEPGTLLSIDLPVGDDGPPVTVLGCVVYVSPRGEGEWVLGCTFASELDDETLRTLAR